MTTSPNYRRISSFITDETSQRLDEAIRSMKEKGVGVEASDLIEMGVIKVLEGIDAGTSIETQTDADEPENTEAAPREIAPRPDRNTTTLSIPAALRASAKPSTKSLTRRKIGPYITHKTGERMDMAILQLSRMGKRYDISDLVEVGLIKVLDMLDAGINDDQKQDAFDLLDDCKHLLEDLLENGALPPAMHGRAETIVTQIQSLD